MTGNSTSYFLRGDDLFGDEYKNLSFDGMISVEKGLTLTKLGSFYAILLYLTLSSFGVSYPKIIKIIAVVATLSSLGFEILLFDAIEGYERESYLLKKMIFSYPIF